MNKRPYVKKSPYWGNLNKSSLGQSPERPSISNVPQAEGWDVAASFDENEHFTAKAACGGGTSSVFRDGGAFFSPVGDGFPNIRSGIMPYSMNGHGYYGISDVINLCYTAYYNFALLRNCIKLLRDFSVSQVHVKSSNITVKTFVETWMETVGMNQFMMQFFLEYYRSGNVFTYRFDGEIPRGGTNALKTAYAAEGETLVELSDSRTIPVRYIILNPMQIYLQAGTASNHTWVRMLSTYEIQKLQNPTTEQDKQVLKDMPENVRKQIQNAVTLPYLFAPLDPKRLIPIFYDKVDYEPLAVPMAFPVLNDIEFKMELRRIDMALASTIENVILLVTTGRAADQWNQVPPKQNLVSLQEMLRNKTIGRVLVADYTTKAEWVMPDLKELLGSDKYVQVDKDIKDGLATIMSGDDKFANASIKIKVFIEGLKEGRRAFMENFLKPEVKKVCAAMGFRHVPELEWEEIRMQDEALMARLYVQMYQLGALTPQELNNALLTGVLPTPDESVLAQEEYKKAREKDLYQPVAPKADPAEGASVGKGRPGGTGGTPAGRKVSTPIGERKVRGFAEALAGAEANEGQDIERPSKYRFGMTKIAHNLVTMNGLRDLVEITLAKKWKLKRELEAEEKMMATSIAQSIAFNEDGGENGEKWKAFVTSYTKEPKEIPLSVLDGIKEIRATFDSEESPVDSWMASVLLKSQVIGPK